MDENQLVGALTMDCREYRKKTGMSQSLLSEMRLSSMHFKWKMDHPTEEQTASQILGSAVHMMLLEMEKFPEIFAVKPPSMTFSSNAGKAWREEHKHKIIISHDDYCVAKEMVMAIQEKDMAQKLLHGHFEKSFFWKDTESGIYCKGRPDIVHFQAGMLVDIKTIRGGHGSFEMFLPHAIRYNYHVQAAYYLDGVAEALKQGEKPDFDFKMPDSFVFVVVESSAPYAVSFFELPVELIEEGRKLYKKWLITYKECLEKNSWPGYSQEILRPRPKTWMFTPIEVEEEINYQEVI